MNNFELDMQEFGKPGVPDSRGAEYFVDEAPPFRCPHGMSRVETLEDCLVHYREANLQARKKRMEGEGEGPLCQGCSTGLRVRKEYSKG